MGIHLTMEDIVYAAVLAFFFTWLIQNVSKIFRSVGFRAAEFDYKPKDLEKMLQKCYILFPKDIILFRGKTFKRGMNVRVTTSQHKVLEGQLIGSNSENMICLLTTKYVVAQELNSIEDIILVDI